MTENLSEYRRLLNIGPEDDERSLKAAFRRSARSVHPDLHPEDPDAAAKFKKKKKAFAALTAMAEYRQAQARKRSETSPPEELEWGLIRLENKGLERIYHLALKENIAFGRSRLVVPHRIESRCPDCRGKGRVRDKSLASLFSAERVCEKCSGQGSVHRVGRVEADLGGAAMGPLCLRFKGRGGLEPVSGARGDLVLLVRPNGNQAPERAGEAGS